MKRLSRLSILQHQEEAFAPPLFFLNLHAKLKFHEECSAEDGFLVYQKFFTDLLRMEAAVVGVASSTLDGQRKIHRSIYDQLQARATPTALPGYGRQELRFPRRCLVLLGGARRCALQDQTNIPTAGGGLSLELPTQLSFLEGHELNVVKGAIVHQASNEAWKVKRLPGEARSAMT